VAPGAFRVTSTFAEHVASGRGPGVDLGNGRCGDPVMAMHDGTVTLSGLLGTAKVIRIKAPDGIYESGYAHLATILPNAALGKFVKRGIQIGVVGMTGADACHLHLGLKKSGTEVDSWPLMDQVIAEAKAVAAAAAPLQTKIVNLKKKAASYAADVQDD
jgi:murein DD-endopeptidase MepM/ murein hydrolase activator NlpD